MATVHYGTDQDFSTMVHGLPNVNTMRYIENQLKHVDRSMFINPEFIDRAYERFTQFGSDSAILKARALLNATGNFRDPNTIRELVTLEDFQTAPPVMQRYLMACPTLRLMAQEDRCDGYISSGYKDLDPEAIGENHLEYRQVMSGIVNTDVSDDVSFTVTHYFDPTSEERELTASEKLDIYSSWKTLEDYLATGADDPSDVFGGYL